MPINTIEDVADNPPASANDTDTPPTGEGPVDGQASGGKAQHGVFWGSGVTGGVGGPPAGMAGIGEGGGYIVCF